MKNRKSQEENMACKEETNGNFRTEKYNSQKQNSADELN